MSVRRNRNMQCEIWRNIPEHIMEIIIAKLEVQSLVRFRSVCKRYNSLISSPSFKFLRFKTHHEYSRPWLLMFNKQDRHRICRAYDTFRGKWHIISVEFLPYDRGHQLQLLTASSQLLCFTAQSCVILCNPLTKTWRRLISPCVNLVTHQKRRANRPATAMATIAPDEDILIMVSNCRATIYSTKADSWLTNIDSVPRSNLRSEAIFCKRSFYFITWEAVEVVAYDLEQSRWRTMESPMVQEAVAFGRLVSCGGRAFVVGGIGSDGIAKSLCLWELNEISSKCGEVDYAPEMVSTRIFSACYHSYEHIYCFGHGEFICVACISWPEVLIYSLSRRTWEWLPPCPVISNMASSCFRWVSFNPTLNGLV